MNNQILIPGCKSFIKTTFVCFLILIASGNLLAQYKGAPVKRNKLIQAIRSRQLQTRDIVTVINNNGVDFRLTPAARKELIAAGARPAVIEAVRNNPRSLSNKISLRVAKNTNRTNEPVKLTYDDLLDKALYSYKNLRNPQGALRLLEQAATLNPENSMAYQMLGYIYLYGLNNFAQAEKAMSESIRRGGSAVFRVFHDDNGKFTRTCTGSLFVSRDNVRFESDGNIHTFEASSEDVDQIKIDSLTTPTWKKHSIYKIILRHNVARAKFRFAPLTGEQEESKMVERLIRGKSDLSNSKSSAIKLF